MVAAHWTGVGRESGAVTEYWVFDTWTFRGRVAVRLAVAEFRPFVYFGTARVELIAGNKSFVFAGTVSLAFIVGALALPDAHAVLFTVADETGAGTPAVALSSEQTDKAHVVWISKRPEGRTHAYHRLRYCTISGARTACDPNSTHELWPKRRAASRTNITYLNVFAMDGKRAPEKIVIVAHLTGPESDLGGRMGGWYYFESKDRGRTFNGVRASATTRITPRKLAHDLRQNTPGAYIEAAPGPGNSISLISEATGTRDRDGRLRSGDRYHNAPLTDSLSSRRPDPDPVARLYADHGGQSFQSGGERVAVGAATPLRPGAEPNRSAYTPVVVRNHGGSDDDAPSLNYHIHGGGRLNRTSNWRGPIELNLAPVAQDQDATSTPSDAVVAGGDGGIVVASVASVGTFRELHTVKLRASGQQASRTVAAAPSGRGFTFLNIQSAPPSFVSGAFVMVWHQGGDGVKIAVSLDDGNTFQAPTNLVPAGQAGVPSSPPEIAINRAFNILAVWGGDDRIVAARP